MHLKTRLPFCTGSAACDIAQQLGILIERDMLPLNAPVDALDLCCAALAAKMELRAADIGADAVIGVEFRLDALPDRLIVSMLGNAVRLKNADQRPEYGENEPCDVASVQPAACDSEAEARDAVSAQAWSCAVCGAENDPAFIFCPKCGHPRSSGWQCARCGQQNFDEYRFCSACGTPCEGSR